MVIERDLTTPFQSRRVIDVRPNVFLSQLVVKCVLPPFGTHFPALTRAPTITGAIPRRTSGGHYSGPRSASSLIFSTNHPGGIGLLASRPWLLGALALNREHHVESTAGKLQGLTNR